MHPKIVTLFLFQYADSTDYCTLLMAAICATVSGASVPLHLLILRYTVNTFTEDIFIPENIYQTSKWFALIGVATLILGFCQDFFINVFTNRQINRIRLLFFASILRQDIPWFDEQSSGSLISKLSQNIDNIQLGMGSTLGDFIKNLSGFIIGIIINFLVGWKLAIVACAMLPIIGAVFGYFGFLMKHFTVKEITAYSRAGAISSEVLESIRTVVAYGGEKKEVRRYSEQLGMAEKAGLKKSIASGAVNGTIALTVFCFTAILFWYGFKLIVEEDYDAGAIVTVFINVLLSSIFLGNAIPCFQNIMNAQASATEIYGIIERTPHIDKDNHKSCILNFSGNVEFKNVTFAYPSRPDIIVLVENVNIKKLDLKAYRSQIGYVQQEPVLFQGTISDNIRLGKLDATQDEIEEAAKLANAHDFIKQLPEAYNNFVAERGGGMSGGQKQRIAIARALIRKPKLLLLDEATSALDMKSERVVQMALNRAREGRTVVVVAHRLSTVRNADVIIVLDKGVIRESGTHDELVAQNGAYAAMLRNQAILQSVDNEKVDEVPENKYNVSGKDLSTKLESICRSDYDQDNMSVTNEIAPYRKCSLTSITSVASNQEKKIKRSPNLRILGFNKPELLLIILGCFCCLLSGTTQPAFAILYTEMYRIFPLRSNPDLMFNQLTFVCGMMVVVGVLRFVANISQGFLFGKSGSILITRIRSMVFESMLNQEIGWFDKPENQTGVLTAKLESEASKVAMISGSQLGLIVEAVALIFMSFVAAFINSWQLTLIIIIFYPLIVVGGFLQMRTVAGSSNMPKVHELMKVAQEAIGSSYTVTAFTLENYFFKRFQSLAVVNLKVFVTVHLSAQSLGRTASLALSSKAISSAAESLLEILDRAPLISTNDGIVPREKFKGNISFKNNFSHTIKPSQTVALVGPSGCGKSTLLQLVMRFYDPSYNGPDSGVFFDNINIRNLAPSWIRQQISIVSQEPTLFDLTIRENIAYGDNTREVTMDEIVEAARAANIHDFIVTLPNQYETNVGQRGTKLSGGQKQRIAIARALVRKPTLLLLDEATSALDSKSERIVQKSIDTAMESRTSLVVAHRLSTIINADLVVVLHNGRKVEEGSPQTLLEMKGAFYALYHMKN
ncbi:Multidrug resistance protein 1A [Schistosoma japonicum]|nr:Multidrug resistance protein 1A [Schistosoma japonicum]